jgi:hypothetical protein
MIVKTPRQQTQEWRERLQKVKAKLETAKPWLNAFTHKFPQYAGRRDHLANVMQGASIDKEVILLFEDFANLLDP